MADLINQTVADRNHIKGFHGGVHVSTVYVGEFNSKKGLEHIHYTNELFLSVTKTEFGNNVLAYIPTTFQFIRDVFLEIGVTSNQNDALLPNNFTAYSFIETFQYRVPGCQPITIDGKSLEKLARGTVDTEMKKKMVRYSSELGYVEQNQVDNLVAILPFPWSSMRGGEDKMKPFWNYGTVMQSNSGLEINIKLRNKNELSTNAYLTCDHLKLWFEYGKVTTEDQLNRGLLKYPCFIPYCFSYPYTLQIPGTIAIPVNGLRSGDTNHFMFSFSPTFLRNAPFHETYCGIKVKRIALTYSGQKFFESDEGILDLWDTKYNKNMCIYEGEISKSLQNSLREDGTQYAITATSSVEMATQLNYILKPLYNYLKLNGILDKNYTVAGGANETVATILDKYIKNGNEKWVYDALTEIRRLGNTNAYMPPTSSFTNVDLTTVVNVTNTALCVIATLEFALTVTKILGEAMGGLYGLKNFPFFYYKIPIAENIETNHDYSLGGDFKGLELNVQFDSYLKGTMIDAGYTQGEVNIVQMTAGSFHSVSGNSNLIQ